MSDQATAETHPPQPTPTPPKTRVQLPEYAEQLFRQNRYKVLYGGRGAGRSWAAARVLLLLMAQRPLRVLCAREFQRSIADSVHRLLCDQIELMKLPGFFITQREIRHALGGSFLFEGLRHNITKIKSLEGLDIAWVEEAERVSADSWEVLIPTIRKPGSEIWVTFNPDQEADPTYQRFIKNREQDWYIKRCSWRDNPWFPDTLRKEMEYLYRVDPHAAAHVWDGECRTITDAQVLRGKWIIEDFTPLDTWHGPYYGVDWGFARDPTTAVRVWVADSRLYVEHEAYGLGVDIDKTPRLFERIPEIRKHTIRADSARPETISYMARCGFRIRSAPKWQGSVEDGITHLRGYESIVIHPRCRYAAQEARLWSYKTDRLTGDVLPKLKDGNDNIWDAVRYALAPLIRQRGAPMLGRA